MRLDAATVAKIDAARAEAEGKVQGIQISRADIIRRALLRDLAPAVKVMV